MKEKKTYRTEVVEKEMDMVEEPAVAYGIGGEYYISPLVKAVETGIDWAKGLSEDYKKEIRERKEAKGV